MLRPGLCSKKNWGLDSCVWSLLCGVVPETSSIMRVLQRAPVSVIITLLDDSERSLNKKWLRPVTNKSNPPLIGNQSETPSNFQLKLFYFIYLHKETYIVIPKIKSENIACIVPHKNLLLFWYPSWIFWRNTYRPELLAFASTLRNHSIAFRALALLNTPPVSFLVSNLSQCMRFPTMWYVRPAKAQTSLRISAV